MPENIKALMDSAPAGLWALMSAVILSVLRILGDEAASKWQRISIEIPTAACIGYASGMAAHEFGFGVGTVLVIGTVIGHVGTETIRNAAKNWLNRGGK